MTTSGHGASNELVAEMDECGKWIQGKDMDEAVKRIQDEQKKADLLKSLNVL